MIRNPRLAFVAAAVAIGAAVPAFAQDARDANNQAPAHRALGLGDTNSLQDSPKLQLPARATAGHSVTTRDEVRDELKSARQAGAVTPEGNIGDDNRTLMAREQYTQLQGQQAQAEIDRQAAVDAAASSTPQQAPTPVAPFGVDDTVNPQSPAAGGTAR